ncbi:MAG TPA: hypothetical protein VMC79_06320, partial [Rectinemataceae bacterium]|nr:hypothetical protein [Rectinemataceae bacterium]
MKLSALVYAGSLSPRALMPLAGSASAYDRALAFASGLPGIERLVIAEGELPVPPGAGERIRKPLWTVDSILETLGQAGEGM